MQVCDPEADPPEAVHEYGITLTQLEKLKPASAVVLAVAHHNSCKMTALELLKLMKTDPTLIEVKSVFNPEAMK